MNTRLLTIALLLVGTLAQADQLTISLGTAPSGTGGDSNRTAFGKANTNFTELYTDVATLEASLAAKQALDSDITAIAALTTATYGRSLLTLADASAGRTSLGLVIGTDVQAFDTDLSLFAAITPSANAQSLLGAANFAAMRALLDLEAGTDFNAFDTELGQIAALADPNADRILFWDDSAGAYTHLTLGTNLSITGTTINATGGGAGTGSVTTIKENDVQLGGADIVTLDFLGADFDLSESPDTEVQVVIAAAIARDAEVTALTDALDLRLDDVETDVWEIADPAADAFVYWNDTSNAVETATGGTGLTVVSDVVKISECWPIAISDLTTAHTTGTSKAYFRAPYACTVTAVRASLLTASSSGIPTWDINEAGTTILGTKLTIDASEKTSTTAATAAVISDTAIAADAEITIDIDTAGTGAAGGIVYLYIVR